MNKTSIYNIKIDFDKSHGCYVFDKNTKKYYLDFMGMYSSLPLGYNHNVFDSAFETKISKIAKLKLVNCEILSDEFDQFYNEFKLFTKGDNYHFVCTGALAVEAAIKTAMWYKGPSHNGYVLSIKNSFHGINSIGNIITSRFPGVDIRLGNLPGLDVWPSVKNIPEAIKHIKNSQTSNLKGIIIEPIQATYGDHYLPIDQLKELRDVCTKYNIPLIFDEIQTGFGSSGNIWYSERIGVKPDITVFGKKSQVSGIMVNASHSKVFEVPKRLSVTFDGDLVDMVRCQYIIKAIKELKLLETMPERSSFFANALKSFGVFDNIKATGFLFCLDMKDSKSRDIMVKKLHSNGMMVNPTGERSIRMRPNLATTMKEFSDAKIIIENSL
tara:strand:- start:7347 stop:8495 length:1149 start_codon:yes stop_codon:yes gene_type:complete